MKTNKKLNHLTEAVEQLTEGINTMKDHVFNTTSLKNFSSKGKFENKKFNKNNDQSLIRRFISENHANNEHATLRKCRTNIFIPDRFLRGKTGSSRFSPEKGVVMNPNEILKNNLKRLPTQMLGNDSKIKVLKKSKA